MKTVSAKVRKKVKWDKKKQNLIIEQPLSTEEAEEVKAVFVMEESKAKVDAAVEKSHQEVTIFQCPSEQGELLRVPQMSVLIDGELRLFDEPEAIDYPWELPVASAVPKPEDKIEINKRDTEANAGIIDVTDEGKLIHQFQSEVERDLLHSYTPENWTEAKLATWFCHQIKDETITHQSKRLFVSEWIKRLLAEGEIDLAVVNRHKFSIRNLIDHHVTELRKDAIASACEEFLFGADAMENLKVGSEYEYVFDSVSYAPISYYDESDKGYQFEKHFYPVMGGFDSDEEFLCAQWLDREACKGRMQYWVRNLEGKRAGAFFLQMGEGRFYPDFICKLNDDSILIVEYKGAHLWGASEEKRRIGNLWAEMSGGSCKFVMITEKNWAGIEEFLS